MCSSVHHIPAPRLPPTYISERTLARHRPITHTITTTSHTYARTHTAPATHLGDATATVPHPTQPIPTPKPPHTTITHNRTHTPRPSNAPRSCAAGPRALGCSGCAAGPGSRSLCGLQPQRAATGWVEGWRGWWQVRPGGLPHKSMPAPLQALFLLVEGCTGAKRRHKRPRCFGSCPATSTKPTTQRMSSRLAGMASPSGCKSAPTARRRSRPALNTIHHAACRDRLPHSSPPQQLLSLSHSRAPVQHAPHHLYLGALPLPRAPPRPRAPLTRAAPPRRSPLPWSRTSTSTVHWLLNCSIRSLKSSPDTQGAATENSAGCTCL